MEQRQHAAQIARFILAGKVVGQHIRAELNNARAWPEDGNDVEFSRNKGIEGSKPFALTHSIMPDIADNRVTSAEGNEVSIWEIHSNLQKHGISGKK
ncbi:hypothetical protein KX928_05530 [Roseobacter sp. YSTF-M11]|uniref:Uncharacterized protein n=1 Tax=Roseobacter insulae TaxID=2859783 RepID=A0A9X1FTA4_9RHOB|nr:hypothetical protein [Roseobacter insulae]MBW4707242.1 hypothetical protein [Roseobacter insulae]